MNIFLIIVICLSLFLPTEKEEDNSMVMMTTRKEKKFDLGKSFNSVQQIYHNYYIVCHFLRYPGLQNFPGYKFCSQRFINLNWE